MQTSQQKIIQEILDRHSYIADNGEVVATIPQGANRKVSIFGLNKTLRQWSYFLYYGVWAEKSLRTASRYKNSLEPTLLHMAGGL